MGYYFAKASAGGGGVTPTPGAFAELFPTSYTQAGWTEVNSTIAVNAALPAGSGLTTATSLNLTYAGGAGVPYTHYNINFGGSTKAFRIYLYIDSEGLADTDKRDILSVTETATDPSAGTDLAFALRFEQTGGVLRLRACNHAGTLSTGQIVTAGKWYRIEFKYVCNTVNGLTFKLYEGAAEGAGQVGSTEQLDTSNWFLGHLHLGMGFADNTDAVHLHYVALGISDDFIGP